MLLFPQRWAIHTINLLPPSRFACRQSPKSPQFGRVGVVAAGQERAEVRADEPAEALAVIILSAVLFSAELAVRIGSPPGSSPLGRLALAIVLRGMRP
jgi:hypothetical protein